MPGRSRAARAAIWGIEYDNDGNFQSEIETKLKVIFVLRPVLFLVSVAAIDAKSSGRSGGKSSGSYSKSVSSSGSHPPIGDAAKVAGIASVPAIAKSTKKTHLDDDLFENETENETAQQSPGMGALPAFLAMGMLLLAWRK
jgi:hypothetical protein